MPAVSGDASKWRSTDWRVRMVWRIKRNGVSICWGMDLFYSSRVAMPLPVLEEHGGLYLDSSPCLQFTEENVLP